MRRLLTVAVGLSLGMPCAAATLELGLGGDLFLAAGQRSRDFKTELDAQWWESATPARTRLGLGGSLAYYHEDSRLAAAGFSQRTRVRTVELRPLKVSLKALAGFELEERGVVPYVLGGAQHVDSLEQSRGEDVDEEDRRERYWSALWGAGVGFTLSRRLGLDVEYERNAHGGRRRTERVSAALKLLVLGDPDD